jgi:hypothetical protein
LSKGNRIAEAASEEPIVIMKNASATRKKAKTSLTKTKPSQVFELNPRTFIEDQDDIQLKDCHFNIDLVNKDIFSYDERTSNTDDS